MTRNHNQRRFTGADNSPLHFNHDPESGGHPDRFGAGFDNRFGGFGPGGPRFGGHGFGGGPGFGPRGQRRAGKGDIRSAILSLLAEKPSNGYGLIKAIVEKTDGVWRPSPGSVYPTLQQLVDEDLIVSNGDDRKTEFQLTETGRAYVDEHADDFVKAWDATSGHSESTGEFRDSVGKLMGVVAQFRFASTDAQRAAAAEKLNEARRALYLILAD